MSFFTENWILILVAFVSGGMLVWPLVQRSSGGSASVGTTEAVRLINRERGVLIDVCEPDEFAQGHAKGARNIPLGKLDGSKDLPSNKALPLIVLCATGARANRAVGLLRKAGYAQAVAVAGGVRAWREATLPIARPGDAPAKADERGDKPAKDTKASRGARRAKSARADGAAAPAAVAAPAAAPAALPAAEGEPTDAAPADAPAAPAPASGRA